AQAVDSHGPEARIVRDLGVEGAVGHIEIVRSLVGRNVHRPFPWASATLLAKDFFPFGGADGVPAEEIFAVATRDRAAAGAMSGVAAAVQVQGLLPGDEHPAVSGGAQAPLPALEARVEAHPSLLVLARGHAFHGADVEEDELSAILDQEGTV